MFESAVLEETFEIIITFDKSGKILFANRSAREKLGYTEEEMAACSMPEIFWQEFQMGESGFAPFEREKLLGKEEGVMYRKNSSCFPVELHFIQVRDGVECLMAEDITQRKNMEINLRKLKEEEENNLRVRDEFTANVTHELRTPVNGIKGHVSSLLDSGITEDQRRILDIILYCCDNMSAIINNLLDFSKLEAGKFTLDECEFDFYKMMDQMIATHMVEINKKELRLRVNIDKNVPQLLIGDALRIGQILNNLLSNAVKFTMVGQISVDVSKTMQIDDEVELFFMVKDSGIGISREEQDSLFESFKQADASITRRFGGTGLGLSITRQLVQMMNGNIYVESEKGKGSCFSFNIKLHTNQDVKVSADLSETYENWSHLTMGMREESEGDFMEFGSEENIAELRKRMEKLVLSIELASWQKAETMAETVKALVKNGGDDFKRPILQLEMAIRKANHDRSIAAYDKLVLKLKEKLGDDFEVIS